LGRGRPAAGTYRPVPDGSTLKFVLVRTNLYFGAKLNREEGSGGGTGRGGGRPAGVGGVARRRAAELLAVRRGEAERDHANGREKFGTYHRDEPCSTTPTSATIRGSRGGS